MLYQVGLLDRGSVERFEVNEWSESDDMDRQREYVWPMNQVLREDLWIRHIWRCQDEGCFYFLARHSSDGIALPRSYRYRSHQKETVRKVVTIHHHPKTGELRYCRHHAMKCNFERFHKKWCLAITPHYIYTADGKSLYPFAEELLSGMKKRERQNAVLGQTLMCQRKLTESNKTLFSKNQDRKPLIIFGDLLTIDCKCGVPDSSWLPGDTDQVFFEEGSLF
jgi:hypothetical protein